MIRISVEVCSGATRFRVGVMAESIEQAVRLADARYLGSEVKVLFPIDPEPFFVVGEPAVSGSAIWPEVPEEAAS